MSSQALPGVAVSGRALAIGPARCRAAAYGVNVPAVVKCSGPRFRGLLVVMCIVAAALAVPSAALAVHFHWSAPALIDTQLTATDGISINSVACPSASLCVAGDTEGGVLTTSNASGGRSAWTRALVDRTSSRVSNAIFSMSCPAVSLCVAGDSAGNVLTSTAPAAGAASWSRAHVDSSFQILGMSCPSTSLCVGVDNDGNVLTSVNPTGGAGAWTRASIDGTNRLQGVSCPSASFCATVDFKGNVVVSANPTGGASQWTLSNIDGANSLFSISCPSTSFCAATDDRGNVLTSTSPAGGAPAWTVTPGVGLRVISCPSTSLCVTGGQGINTSTNPTGGAGTWVPAHGDATFGMVAFVDAIACRSITSCTAVDGNGFVASSSDVGIGNHWTSAQIDGTPTLFGVSCPARRMCFGADDSGTVFFSTNPGGGAAAWTAVHVGATQAGAQLYALSCPTRSMCVAPADYGPLGTSGSPGHGLISTNPTGPANSWRAFYLLHGISPVVHGYFAVACTSRSFCAVMQDDRKLFVSTHPTMRHSWRKRSNRGGRLGVFCPARGRCLAPEGSCPTRRLCVDLNGAGDGGIDGRIAVSTNPASGAHTWRSLRIDRGHLLNAVTCPTSGLCVAVDNAGNALISTNPARGAAAWHMFHIDGAALEAVSCSSASFCVAVDRAGQVVVGTRTG
ncbi:MAG: hypothetical protein M3018_07840 [Actinomycetota bacterium]|nr:hypothetical protein [Actinomycetota bacterium]